MDKLKTVQANSSLSPQPTVSVAVFSGFSSTFFQNSNVLPLFELQKNRIWGWHISDAESVIDLKCVEVVTLQFLTQTEHYKLALEKKTKLQGMKLLTRESSGPEHLFSEPDRNKLVLGPIAKCCSGL